MKKRLFAGVAIGAAAMAVTFVALQARTAKEVNRLRVLAGDRFSPPTEARQAITVAVFYAQSMLGKIYDPLMGRFGDPLGKAGCVVCIDVPVRSYQAAGISIPLLLRDAAKKNPEWFSIGPNNPPSSSFFYRRVRNYHPLFQHHPALLADTVPKVGDWVFYGKFHIALVVDVGADGSFRVIEASPLKGRVAVSEGKYMEKTWGRPAFFGRLRLANHG
ncbi:MAG: hypothetical protein AAB320_06435 [Elusimicrobiota bacterium]